MSSSPFLPHRGYRILTWLGTSNKALFRHDSSRYRRLLGPWCKISSFLIYFNTVRIVAFVVVGEFDAPIQGSLGFSPYRWSASSSGQPGPGLEERVLRPDIAGGHWERQNLYHGKCHREDTEANPGYLPQQDLGRPASYRVQGVLSRKCCGVLCQLLWLLSAGGLYPQHRPLYWEGNRYKWRDWQATACRYHVALHSPRRSHRRLGVVYL